LTEKPPLGNPKWDGARPDPATSPAPYRIYNIGNNQPVEVIRLVQAIEAATGKKAKIVSKPIPPGDVVATAAEVKDLEKAVGFRPNTPLEEGVKKFVEWYRSFAAG
jgi:UDP-glucuronate 4-epimerase